jgi:carboxyl-terminal processing protease
LSRRPIGAVALLGVLLLGIVIGGQVGGVRNAVDDLFGNPSQDATSEALDVIDENYFHEIDRDQLESASVRAIINDLKKKYGDRFSHYFGPHAYKRFQEVEGGSFSGVGMAVNEVPRGLRVGLVFPGSPAKEAGIEEGDLITAVDGRSLKGVSAEEATAEIKGKSGTTVTLTVVSPGAGGPPRVLNLTRREVKVPAVQSRLIHANGTTVGYARLLGFSSGADRELRAAVESVYERGATGLVLDLRGNGGGLLDQAVLTASIFVEDGTIVSTSGRAQPEHVFEATGDSLPEHPMVVLINGDTASAAEILTAALEQADLATVVGTRSFGKGTFQEVIQLDNGGALDLTEGEYLTRDGTSINRVGIKPEVKANDKPATKPDEALQTALDVLGSEIGGGGPPAAGK